MPPTWGELLKCVPPKHKMAVAIKGSTDDRGRTSGLGTTGLGTTGFGTTRLVTTRLGSIETTRLGSVETGMTMAGEICERSSSAAVGALAIMPYPPKICLGDSKVKPMGSSSTSPTMKEARSTHSQKVP